MMTPPPFSKNSDNAKWLPFKTNMLMDLGSGGGKRELMFGFKYKGQTNSDGWGGSSVMVETSPPFVVFTEPKETIDRVHFSGPVHELVLGHG
jgi:hypothetical protein